MYYLVTYDIRDPARLRRVASAMKDFGVRVQYSVFECDIDDRKVFEEMLAVLKSRMNPEEDSVRIYEITYSLKQIKILGQGELTGFPEVIVI